MADQSAVNRPNYTCPAYDAMAPRWTFVRDMRTGTEAIQDDGKRTRYLPRFEGEHQNDYEARVGMTFAYDAVAQAVGALVGLVFAKDPELGGDVPPALADLWENIDGEGLHGAVFAQYVLDHALQDGHCGILAEKPPVEAGLSAKQEADLGVRPYLTFYPADRILSWRTDTVHGMPVLTQVVLREDHELPSGAFGVTTRTRYRVFRLATDAEMADGSTAVRYETWEDPESDAQTKEPIKVAEGTVVGPTRIPFSVVYGGQQQGTLRSTPPLLGLAYSNLDHTQTKSDRRFSMHKCAVPTAVYKGRIAAGTQPTADKVITGPSYGIDISTDGDAFYMEPQGTSLAELRQELLDIEKRMGSQGLSLLKKDQREQTATEARIEEAQSTSQLGRAARSLQDALEASFGFLADFMRLQRGSGGSVKIARDFSAVGISEADLRLASDMEERGQLTLDTLLRIYKAAGKLPDDLEPEDEAEAVRRFRAVEPMGGDDEGDALPEAA